MYNVTIEQDWKNLQSCLDQTANLIDALNLWNDKYENKFIENPNKPKKCELAFSNGTFYITPIYQENYDKADITSDIDKCLKEIQLLNHTNLIKLFDYDCKKGYMIWEDISGYICLSNRYPKFNLIDNPKITSVDLNWQDCLNTVVDYLHNTGLTHLDLECHNIFVKYSPKEILLKVGDLLSIRKIDNEKYFDLYDEIHPPSVKYLDALNQLKGVPKTIVLTTDIYTGKVKKEHCIDNWKRNLAFKLRADMCPLNDTTRVTTRYEQVIVIAPKEIYKEITPEYLRRLNQIGNNIRILEDKEHLFKLI